MVIVGKPRVVKRCREERKGIEWGVGVEGGVGVWLSIMSNPGSNQCSLLEFITVRYVPMLGW